MKGQSATPEYTIETFRPDVLSEEEILELVELVRKPFNWYAPDSTDESILHLLRGRGASYVDIVRYKDNPCGFLASEAIVYGEYTACYHHGVSIMPAARGKKLYLRLTDLSLARVKCDFLVARTQNPRVYESLRRYANQGRIYPNPDRTPPDFVVAIARHLCTLNTFEADTLIVRNAHGFVRADRSFMTARDPQLNEFFARNLGRDDGFMVVVALT